jgi:protocatechuate 3,4-dioxygenase beta subunit
LDEDFTIGPIAIADQIAIHFEVYGQQDRLVTQMYFEGDPYNNTDSFLQSAGRPELLITKLLPPPPELESESKLVVFDIVLYAG